MLSISGGVWSGFGGGLCGLCLRCGGCSVGEGGAAADTSIGGGFWGSWVCAAVFVALPFVVGAGLRMEIPPRLRGSGSGEGAGGSGGVATFSGFSLLAGGLLAGAFVFAREVRALICTPCLGGAWGVASLGS